MTTRSDLIADLRNWAARDDLTDAVLVTVLRLAQSAIDRDLRLPDQQAATRLSVTDAEGAVLPDNHLETRAVALISQSRTFGFRQETVTEFNSRLHAVGQPPADTVAWVERGGRILVRPTPQAGSTVELAVEYFAQFAPLLQNDDTNWLLRHSYDTYFFACMHQVGRYLEDDMMADKWAKEYGIATDQLSREAQEKQIITQMTHVTVDQSQIANTGNGNIF